MRTSERKESFSREAREGGGEGVRKTSRNITRGKGGREISRVFNISLISENFKDDLYQTKKARDIVGGKGGNL